VATSSRLRGRRQAGQRRGRGQSLVEFAIALPVVMLMLLFGLDFGRVFLGWVTLNNAVREAANFAALNPTAWTAPGNPTVQAEYARLVAAESGGINCTLPSPLPDPTFPSGTAIGSPAVVEISCRFSLITPLISAVVGNAINVTSSAAFPVRSGTIEGVPVGSTAPIPTGSATPVPSGSASPAPTSTASPAPTPTPMCTVPTLTGLKTNKAVAPWTAAGFVANNLVFNPGTPPVYTIVTQSLTPGTSAACSAVMTVTK
jgi:Flp pilus assembly protein TadG